MSEGLTVARRLFQYDPTDADLALSVACHGEVDEQARYELLMARGFQVVWSTSLCDQLVRLGAWYVVVNTEGARWPLSRVAADGKWVRLFRAVDVDLLQRLIAALSSEAKGDDAFDALLSLIANRAAFTNEDIDALESIVRMGSAKAVRAWLGMPV